MRKKKLLKCLGCGERNRDDPKVRICWKCRRRFRDRDRANWQTWGEVWTESD